MKKLLVYAFVLTLALGTAALAGDFTYTVPTAGVTPGPTWASQISTALTILKTHTHTGAATEGPQLGSAALSVDADISFNSSYAATDLQHTTYTSQSSSGSVANKSVYVLNNDLYYKNNSGTAVRLTNGSSTAQTSEGIFGDYRNAGGTAYYDSSNSVLLMMTSASTPSYSESDIATNVIDLGSVMADSFQLQGGTNAPEMFMIPGGLADVGHVVVAFDDDSEIGAPTYSAEDGEASDAIGIWSRRAQPAGTGTTYYGDGFTVDADYGHLTVGSGSTLTALNDGAAAERNSSNGKCAEGAVNCAHYPILQVQGGAYPSELYLRSEDQTAIYFHDTQDSTSATATYLHAIKQTGDDSDSGTVLTIGGYSVSGSFTNVNLYAAGNGATYIGAPTGSVKYMHSSHCQYDTGGVAVDYLIPTSGAVEFDETESKTWIAMCPIPNGGATDNFVIDSITVYFDASADANCILDNLRFRYRAYNADVNGAPTIVEDLSSQNLATSDNATVSLTTDLDLTSSGYHTWIVVDPGNDGANCDDLFFKGYSITYKTDGNYNNLTYQPITISE